MIRIHKLFGIYCLIIMHQIAYGQFANKPFEKPEKFLEDAAKIMKTAPSSHADSIYQALVDTWSSPKLDSSHKQMIFKVSGNMQRAGYKTNPHYESFFAIIAFGLANDKLDSDKLDRFLSVMDTCALQYKKYVTQNFLLMVRGYVTSNQLHSSRFNQLYATEGDFTFGNVYDNSIALKPNEVKAAPDPLLADTSEWFEHLEDTTKTEEEELSWDSIDSSEEEDSSDDWDTSDDSETIDDDWGWGYDEEEEETEEALIDTTTSSTGFLELETTPTDIMPPIIGPYIQLNGVNLSLPSVFDTFNIENTYGKLMAKDYRFVGNGGSFNWESAGISAEELTGNFNDYTFRVVSPELTANDVDLVYPDKFADTVKGQFSYQARPKDRVLGRTFPRFISYNSNVPVKGLMEDVIFIGGFAMKGRHIYSKSINQGPSTMEVNKEGVLKFRATSSYPFIFSDSTISNLKTAIAFYQKNGKDSVSHPSVHLRYNANTQQMSARKSKHEYKYAPFVDSYHKVEINGEYLTWDLQTDSVHLGIINAKNKVPLMINSMDYFDPRLFLRLKGLSNFHPLQLVVGYRKIARSNTFTAAALAKQYKLNPNTVRGSMVGLEQRGFVKYDSKTDLIQVTRKAVLYSYANLRRMDYDNINIRSLNPQGNNATFLLDSMDLEISGVKSFLISDSLRVLVQPSDNSITMKKNRNFEFKGGMAAGKFLYRGEHFNFNYDSFSVAMPYIEELAFVVKDSETGKEEELPNNMVGTGGVLYIANPKNKSGLKPPGKYPKFEATSAGAFYFGGDEILDGAYKNDTTIFFDVPSFTIDSLNNSDPASINFEGTFHSGGIFPIFKENIGIMPDKSFGFEKNTPTEGYPIYESKLKEKAIYYDKITLNNNGIRGNGRIEYLTGKFLSDDFIFFTDSVKTTKGTGGEITAGSYGTASYPAVQFNGYNMRWLVNKDSMLITSQSGKTFDFYQNQFSFDGTLALSPKNLFGSGTFESSNSATRSKNFAFEENTFRSTNSVFLIKSQASDRPSMKGVRVSVDFNVAEKSADIYSEKSGDDVFSFPYVQYATSLAKAHWDLKEEKVYLTAADSSKGNLSTFTSLNRYQDELEFEAKAATYDQKEQTLNIEGIKGIRVANVIIVPDSGKAVVRAGGEMDVLSNSSVVINSFTKYHTLTDGHLKIRSRKRFDGDAIYTYINDVNDSMYITFDHFDVKTITNKDKGSDGPSEKFETSANAIVSEADSLKIFSGLLYKGKVRLIDYKKYLEFDGLAKLDIEREGEASWFTYKSNSEESHGKIYIDENTKQAGFSTKLATGLFLGSDTKSLYGTMLEFKRARIRDKAIFQGRGLLTYNNASQDYIIAPTEKLEGINPKGNKFTYNHQTKKVTYDGTFNLIKENKDFVVQASGKGMGNINDSTYLLNTMLLLGFEPNSAALKIMLDDFSDKKNDEPANPIFSELKNKVAQFVEPKVYQKFVQDAETTGNQSIATLFPNQIGLSDVTLKWSEENKAFYSEGEIGLSHIFKDNVDTRIKGYIEIPKIEDNGVINIYLENHRGQWYFISFYKGNINVYSSNNDFNIAVDDPKSKDKLRLTDPHEVSIFLEDYSIKYLDGASRIKKDEDDPFKKKKEDEKEKKEKKDGF